MRLLAERLKPTVPSRIRRRGNSYWQEGSVQILQSDWQSVDAAAYGTETSDVGLFWNRAAGILEGTCTCPQCSERGEICKHIWGTIVAADDRGLLTGAREATRLRLEVGDAHPFELGAFPGEDRWSSAPSEPEPPDWRAQLAEVAPKARKLDTTQQAWLAGRQLFYLLDVEGSRRSGTVVIELRCRDRKKDGEWGVIKSALLQRKTIRHLPDPADRQLLAMVSGAQEHLGQGLHDSRVAGAEQLPSQFVPSAEILVEWTRRAVETGRFLLLPGAREEATTLAWDSGEPWRIELEVTADTAPNSDPAGGDGQEAAQGQLWGEAGDLQLQGSLARGEERLPLGAPALLSAAGLVFFKDRAARLDAADAFPWVPLLRREEEIRIPKADAGSFLDTLLSLPQAATLHLPEALAYEEVRAAPEKRVSVHMPSQRSGIRRALEVRLEFEYDGTTIAWEDPRRGIYLEEPARLLLRDREAEASAHARLLELGVHETAASELSAADDSSAFLTSHALTLPESRLMDLTRELTAEGWRVEADGRLYRTADAMDLELTSGIDWFDLRGSARFGDQALGLPRLLKALQRGETRVRLDDGSLGLLPEEWLDRYARLAKMGTLGDERLRFRGSQIGLVDALLAAQPEIEAGPAVAQARERLAGFTGVESKEPPKTFHGTLRDYQKEGLGWLHFLRTFGFGGCLADDMGLGKTVQVLALLESRRKLRHSASTSDEKRPGPSLVVVPRSLIFNWQSEAKRFTPKLRVLDYTGQQRRKERDQLGEYDLVLTTYGTLRRDIADLKEVALDYAVLDEAQAIKNHKSATAKACRLLKADHRLALTGTPMENHVGELMSIFDFLNPGIFGPSRRLEIPKTIREGALAEDGTPHPQLALITGAVRPFILRRTKGQVAKELPEKVEQTLFCQLTPKQRKDYDQLREHYQRALLGQVDEQGLGRSKLHVLEALLRLRQAACHPGLVDPKRVAEDSGKLDLLLPLLDEVIEEGHKALVFSQFTSMLAILRSQLDERGVTYEYLDGRTRKREPRIRRFQEDPDCPLFLISLKAGGVGLNLTAAEYVFVLDPWWNPAVEAQAIDRAHRIGQTQKVFAYRLIARDTVEEKVLALQRSKRQLADAIVRADSSLIRNMTRDDLVELLS